MTRKCVSGVCPADERLSDESWERITYCGGDPLDDHFIQHRPLMRPRAPR